ACIAAAGEHGGGVALVVVRLAIVQRQRTDRRGEERIFEPPAEQLDRRVDVGGLVEGIHRDLIVLQRLVAAYEAIARALAARAGDRAAAGEPVTDGAGL